MSGIWRKKFVFVALFILAIFQSACTTLKPPSLPQPFDDDYAPIINYLSALIHQEMDDGDLTGLSIALVSNQNVLWSEGFGIADKEKDIPATKHTRYRAGSVSKLFNAYAVMQLVEQGKLDLDLPVADFVPGFSINSRFGSTDDITLRTLLSHQSGLPSDMVHGMWSQTPPPLESLVTALTDAYAIAPANSIFNYSNVGVSLSGLAVQSVSDKAYEQYMQDAVLQPLGMSDSDFTGRLAGDIAAAGYINGEQVSELALRDLPAGGLNTTVEDLAKFLIAVHADGEPLINTSSFAQMRQVQNPDRQIDLGQRIGLGWFFDQVPLAGSYEILWHGGRTIAHSTRLSTAPDLGIGVVIMTNSADSTNALERITEKAMQQLYATKGLPEEKAKLADDTLVKLNLNTSTELTGEYAGQFGLIDVVPDDEHYSADAIGVTFSLRPEDGHWFSPWVKLWFIPLRPSDMKTLQVTQATIDDKSRLILQDEGSPFLLGDLVDPYPATEQWDVHLGQYQVKNPVEVPWMRTSDMYLKRAENYYFLEVTGADGNTGKMPVRPLNDQQFVVLGTGRGLGGTATMSGSADVSTFTLSGLVYEKVDDTRSKR